MQNEHNVDFNKLTKLIQNQLGAEWYVRAIRTPFRNRYEGFKIEFTSESHPKTVYVFEIKNGNLLMPKNLDINIRANILAEYNKLTNKTINLEVLPREARQFAEFMWNRLYVLSSIIKNGQVTISPIEIPVQELSQAFSYAPINFSYGDAKIDFSQLKIGDVVVVAHAITLGLEDYGKTRPCLIYAKDENTKRIYICPITTSTKTMDREFNPLFPFNTDYYFNQEKTKPGYLNLYQTRYTNANEILSIIGHVTPHDMRIYLRAIWAFQKWILTRADKILKAEEVLTQSLNIPQENEIQTEEQVEEPVQEQNYVEPMDKTTLQENNYDLINLDFTDIEISRDCLEEIRIKAIEIIEKKYKIADKYETHFAMSGYAKSDDSYHCVFNKNQKNRKKYPQIDLELRKFSLKIMVKNNSRVLYHYNDELTQVLVSTLQKYNPNYYIYLTYFIIYESRKNNKTVEDLCSYLEQFKIKYNGDLLKVFFGSTQLDPELISIDKDFYGITPEEND